MNESPGESVRSGGGRTARRGGPAGIASAPRGSDAGILRWTPKNLGALATRVTPSWEVFLTPDALRGLRRHASEAGADRIAGLLVGRTGEGGERGRRFVLVEECRPHEEALRPATEGEEEFHEELLALREELGEAAVGWYHSHTLLGVFLSERDTRFHERWFPEPWHCAVVLVQEGDGPAGGVFQRTAEYGLRRSIYVPFHEILAEGADLSDGRRRTLVDWENYTADVPVARPTPLRPGRGRTSPRAPEDRSRSHAAGSPEAGVAAASAAAPATEPRPAPAPPVAEAGPSAAPRPGGEAAAQGAAARRGPVRSGPAAGRATAEAAPDVPVVLPPEEEGALLRRHAGKVLGLVAIVGLVVAGWLVWDSVVETSEGRAAAALAQAETWVRERTGAGEEASAEAGEEASEDAPERAGGLFAPLPTGEEAAGGADPETAAQGGAESPGAESPETGPPAVDPGADEGPADEPAGAGEDAGEPPETAEPPPQPTEDAAAAPAVGTAFTEALERFQGAVAEYVGRRAGYDAGEVGCGALAEAYRQVDEAFLTLSARYGSAGGAGEAAPRYGEAASGMEEVDRHFDASGCPRPR